MLTECVRAFAGGVAGTARSCERCPIDPSGHHARLDVPDLSAQLLPFERGVGTIWLRLLQRKRYRETFLVTAVLDYHDDELGNFSCTVAETPDGPPVAQASLTVFHPRDPSAVLAGQAGGPP